MWWLTFVDGLLPIGDIIYWVGCGIFTICAVIVVDSTVTNYCGTSYAITKKQSENVSSTSANIYYAQNGVNRPSSKRVKLQTEHILSGHSADGNRGGPNKSRFPKWMTPAMIERAIREAYENAHKAGPMKYYLENGKDVVRQFFRGEWSGGIIEFWYNYTTQTIETAWPK